MALRVGVLISGRGTNLQSLIDAEGRGALGGASLALVISNRPGAAGLERAASRGIPTRVIEHRGLARPAFEAQLTSALEEARIELVVLAGFMRVLTTGFIRRWKGRLINIHPSLLPAFPGMHAQRQALAAGVRVTGCTVHFVDEGVDTGTVIAQRQVAVRPGDTEETLSTRILEQEHRILPEAVRGYAEGTVRHGGGKPTPAPSDVGRRP